MKKFVIVESPTKAKTIAKFLGDDFEVQSSFGHIRDLPKKKMGVDIEHEFSPDYVVPQDKRSLAAELKKKAAKAEEVFFATDSDREGEAISWHLASIFDFDPAAVKRLTFHEITKEAIEESLKSPRPLDLNLVDAQQARRVLDRLVGYELSPFLWRRVAKGLSAGRVQSAAVRLTVEREREIQKFVKKEFWTIEADFSKNEENFPAKLYRLDGKILEKDSIKSENEAKEILKEIPSEEYFVQESEKKISRRSPPPPFITSTLQQEANRRFGFSAKQTMLIAQQLYEGVDLPGEGAVGLITYMRTDSVNLADKFLNDGRQFISSSHGKEYLSPLPRRYKNKSKLAQEAHEAIRPTEAGRPPSSLKEKIDPRQWKLYDLIWKRALATQMAEAKIGTTNIDIASRRSSRFVFRASGANIIFDGFLKIYPEQRKENFLPSLEKEDFLTLVKIVPLQHFTEPPARYNDATLVKALEERGIGRPSTYAPTISTIIARRYVERVENKRLKPTDMAFLVTDILTEHFPKIVDYQFTAKMEDELDEIAEGKKKWAPLVGEFYFPFHENLEKKYKELSKKELTEEKTEEKCEKCGSAMVIKTGRFGRFLACGNFPQCRNAKPLNGKGVEAKPPPDLLEEKCPECGEFLVKRTGRFGEFVSCSAFPKCRYLQKQRKTTGIACPRCQKGEIAERRTRKRATFFSCDRYPECKFALWQRPTGEKCLRCGFPKVFAKGGESQCGNKECSNAS